MITTGLQAAFAYVLVSEEIRSTLSNPVAAAAIQERFALSNDEFGVLTSLDRSQVRMTAEAVRGKRVELLKRAQPATMSVLTCDQEGQAVLAGFLRECPPVVAGADEQYNRLLADSRRLVAYLATREADGVPPYLPDLARYETVQLELSFSVTASEWATRAAGITFDGPMDGMAFAERRFILGGHVVLEVFAYDVVALAGSLSRGIDEGHDRPRVTRMAVTKPAGGLGAAVYRLGRFPFAVLSRCDGRQSVGDITAAARGWEAPASDPVERVAEVIRNGIAQCFLVPAERLEL